ncbi:MAG: patatin-like phospholipase family protein [Candidatus Sabulitectum sp.]|nr:patatin-like phospholipase family protein [Candidatus Sabulitectum sp.]
MHSNSAPPGRIGLALGSGSARGWAHIGVIRALEEAGINVDCIAGTSIGALVGAVYASGRFAELEKAVLQLERKQILLFSDIILPKSGLIDGRKISNLIQQHVLDTPIESLPLPLCIIATDLTTGREVVLKDGDISEAVRASVSIPGVFTPVRKEDRLLVDGGLVNPVPVSIAREMGADFVIAVDLSCGVITGKKQDAFFPVDKDRKPETDNSTTIDRASALLNEKLRMLDLSPLRYIRQKREKDSLPGIIDVLMTSVKIMQSRITTVNFETDPPDVLIQPNLGHINFMGFYHAEEIIAEGYRAARSEIDKWR